MGEVYLAKDLLLDRKVAIKFLPSASVADERAKKRLIREAQALAKLDHPNICAIHEVTEEGGRTFIVMQYVEGETLAKHIQSKPLSLRESLDLAIQVADALSEAHAQRITHRDVKPQNIMITPRGQVKVLDFGLAKALRERQNIASEAETESLITEPRSVVGTVLYMSPEQVKGETLDWRSDIFSFGCVLYEMVSGHHPFAAENAAATFSLILTSEPLPLARYGDVPPELQRIVRKCLAKDKERRYQSARDLLIDLRNLKRDCETGATSLGQIKTWEVSVGRRQAFVAIALILLALVVGLYLLISSKAAIDSIAVVPFVSVNLDSNMEYLADGIPESISNSLSQLPHLKVMSRNSVFNFKEREINAQEVGKKLGVRAVLTGRVAQRGEGLIINIELVDARDNSLIWGQQYNRKLTDVFAVQEEIAKEVSEKLRLKLTRTELQQLARHPTENLKAFKYYTQGQVYIQRRTREDLLEAIRYCEKAIEEDPNYALAYAGLADAYTTIGIRGYIPPAEGRRKGEAAARQALALDENLAEAHIAIGAVYGAFVPYNLSLGEREMRRAIELSPSSALAHFYLGILLIRQGRLDEALEGLQNARELDPLSSVYTRAVAMHYYFKRDNVRALELLRQANELGPAFSTTWEIGVYIQNGLLSETLAGLERAKLERTSDPILMYSTAMVYVAQGKRTEALQIIKELEAMSGPLLSQAHWIAKIYAALNEKELAFMWLERGLSAGAIGAFYKDEPVWDTIRSDSRFADLLGRMRA